MRRCLPIVIALLVAAACATVPGTGRHQLLLTSAETENRLGLEASRDILKKEPKSNDPELNALVERVGRRIAAATPKNDFQWEYTVLESKEANAFCLPGGKVFVYTGILPYCGSEAGLATVLGHEVAHAIARHGGERMSQGIVAQLGQSMAAAALAAAGVQPTTANAVLVAYGAGAQLGVLLPYSRTHELEADRLGLEYMAKAGYDPNEAIVFWRAFAARGKGGGPTWLSTHPASAERSRQLDELLPSAMALYEQSPKYGRGVTIAAAR
jgi:predicted Zn-dependent protease